MEQINFTGNLERDGNTQMFFVIEKARESVLDFLKRNRESIINLFF